MTDRELTSVILLAGRIQADPISASSPAEAKLAKAVLHLVRKISPGQLFDAEEIEP